MQIFTNKGNPRRPYPNPMLDWAKENEAEVLACQLPGKCFAWNHHDKPNNLGIEFVLSFYAGRGGRFKENRITKTQDIAETLFKVGRRKYVSFHAFDVGRRGTDH
jgi:succinylglutamate desuccinylase